MPVFPCPNPECTKIWNVNDQHIGITRPCPNCNTPATVPPRDVADWLTEQLIDIRSEGVNHFTEPPAELKDYIMMNNIDMESGGNIVRLMYRATTTNRRDALEWLLKSFPVLIKVLGEEHPTTKLVRDNMAIAYEKSGNPEPLEEWLQKNLPELFGE